MLYSVALQLTLCVLWWRQRTFYQSAHVRHLTSAFMRKVSEYSIYFMVATGVTSTVVMVTTRRYAGTRNGCVRSTAAVANLPGILSLAIVGSYHLLFVLLTIFPLLKHRRSASRLQQQHKQLRIYIAVIRRCCVCTLVPFAFSSLCCLCVLFILQGSSHSLYKHLLYDSDLIVLLLCVVASHMDLRALLLFKVKVGVGGQQDAGGQTRSFFKSDAEVELNTVVK